jgi:predicted metal-dependent peptidase
MFDETSNASLSEFQEQLTAARLFLLNVCPFYASILGHLRLIVSRSVPTAAVSSDDRLFINPDFFHSVGSFQRRAFLLAHEALHPALGIFFRSVGHDPELSNVAHDYVINAILFHDRSEWLIEGALHDPRFDGSFYEEVYSILQRERTQNRPVNTAVPLASGIGPDLKGKTFAPDEQGDGGPPALAHEEMTPEQLHESMKRWETWVIEAALNAQAMGRASAGIDRVVKAAANHSVPWYEKLRLAANDLMPNVQQDWSWPSRRYCATGIFLPREKPYGFTAATYMDTSGSISQAQINTAMGHIAAIIELAGGRLRLLQGDAVITGDEWIEELPPRVIGGGGTSFVPLFDYLAASEDRVQMLIIFTDTFGTMPEECLPGCEVIWAVHAKALASGPVAVPFGEIVEIPDAA